jgi:hypothetical protein
MGESDIREAFAAEPPQGEQPGAAFSIGHLDKGVKNEDDVGLLGRGLRMSKPVISLELIAHCRRVNGRAFRRSTTSRLRGYFNLKIYTLTTITPTR